MEKKFPGKELATTRDEAMPRKMPSTKTKVATHLEKG
jgi:hypothetical protein